MGTDRVSRNRLMEFFCGPNYEFCGAVSNFVGSGFSSPEADIFKNLLLYNFFYSNYFS